MNKKIKTIIFIPCVSILCVILIILIRLNLTKKSIYQQLDSNTMDFTIPINNLIEAAGLTITKEINISQNDGTSEENHNYIYHYNINLKDTYLSGTLKKDNGNPISIYLLKDDGKQYYYQDKDWIRKNNLAIGYPEDKLFIDDYKRIVNLLQNIKSSVKTEGETYKVTLEKNVLKKYIEMFSNKDDPSLEEAILIDYQKIDPTNISVYITIEHNNLKEILFDLSAIHKELDNYTYYYSIYFDNIDNINQSNVKIPTNILAALF